MRELRLKMQDFHAKLPCHNPILIQIEWEVQSRLIKKNGVLSVATLFFWKFCFSLRTFYYKKSIWYTKYTNVHIYTFRFLFVGPFSLWKTLKLGWRKSFSKRVKEKSKHQCNQNNMPEDIMKMCVLWSS